MTYRGKQIEETILAMKDLLRRESKTVASVLAIAALASLALVPPNVSAATIPVNDVIVEHSTYLNYTIPLQVSDTVTIDLDVQSGPNLGFYFMNEDGFDAYEKMMEGSPAPSPPSGYSPALSLEDTASIHKSDMPGEGVFYLVILNDDPSQASTVTGSIVYGAQYPDALFTILIIAIAVVFVIATVAAVLITRSMRARAQQYAPPGQPTPRPPQSQSHPKVAPRPVVSQGAIQTCPKCRMPVPPGKAVCPNCGSRL